MVLQNGRKTLVPGFMAGIEAMHKRFGSLPFGKLFEPAIWYAEHGVIPIRFEQFQARFEIYRLAQWDITRCLVSSRSGQLAAKLYTIFQTWLINGLNPQALLLDYFNRCSLHPGKPPPSVNDFLPWKMDQDRKNEFALPKSYKRPA